MAEGMTCYKRDEELCEDEMCLRTGCRFQNEKAAAVHFAHQEPTAKLQFSKLDGHLYQLWRILEWGNHEGFGLPMNIIEEWRQVEIGDIPLPTGKVKP